MTSNDFKDYLIFLKAPFCSSKIKFCRAAILSHDGGAATGTSLWQQQESMHTMLEPACFGNAHNSLRTLSGQQHALRNIEGAPPFACKPSSTGCVHCGRCTEATFAGDKFWGRKRASLPHHRHVVDAMPSFEYSL